MVDNRLTVRVKGRTQGLILEALVDGPLTVQQITKRLNITRQAVYKHISKLRDEGKITLMEGVVNQTGGGGGTCQTSPPISCGTFPPTSPPAQSIKSWSKLGIYIRLHAQQWRIEILAAKKQYIDALQAATRISMDGNTVLLYPQVVIIYSGRSFEGEDAAQATQTSLDYWNNFFCKLEGRLGIMILKDRKQNIRQVAAHYAEVNNGIATDLRIRGERVRIRTSEGKIWATFDWSKPNGINLDEMETLHPDTSRQDMEDVLQRHINEWRQHPEVPTIGQLSKHFLYFMEVQQKMNADLRDSVKAIYDLLGSIAKPREETPMEVAAQPSYIG